MRFCNAIMGPINKNIQKQWDGYLFFDAAGVKML
jgi:hypothetical protein